MAREQFIPEQASEKDVLDMLDRLLASLPLTDEQAVAALSTDATLMFAESKPCWMEESDGVKARAAAVSDAG